MIVLVNRAAGGGRALRLWDDLSPAVRELVGPFRVWATDGETAVRDRIASLLATGERRFIAAGGDGTVNLVVNGILESAPPAVLKTVTLGAIGLGSSNDFHKPMLNGRLLGRIPHKLDFAATTDHDIGLLRYQDPEGRIRQRYWIVNASAGVTADGNQSYNAPDALLRWLKRVSPGRGIGYAALRAILGHRPRLMSIALDDEPPVVFCVSNLGVVKNPHFTGNLRYDTPYEPGSGRLDVHLLEGLGLMGLAWTLSGLARGRFTGRVGTHSWRVTRLTIEAAEPFPVEADGEIVSASKAWFAVLPRALRVCS